MSTKLFQSKKQRILKNRIFRQNSLRSWNSYSSLGKTSSHKTRVPNSLTAFRLTNQDKVYLPHHPYILKIGTYSQDIFCHLQCSLVQLFRFKENEQSLNINISQIVAFCSAKIVQNLYFLKKLEYARKYYSSLP